jgi:PAS domain S-box-containing protein
MYTPSTLYTLYTEEHLFTFKETEHVQNMLLTTAAFFDEADLITRVGKRGVLEDLQGALDSSPFGISVCCARAYMSYPILFVNSALEKMTQYGRKEMVGRNFKMLQGEDTEIGQLELMTMALKENQATRLAITNYRKDGSKFLNMVALKPTFDHFGQCVYIIGVYYDIARKEATMEELQKINIMLAILPFLLGFPEELLATTPDELSAPAFDYMNSNKHLTTQEEIL